MGKADNQQIIATKHQRQLADRLRNSRDEGRNWGLFERGVKEDLRGTLDGATGITLVTQTGEEVASVTESDPYFNYDYKRYFEDHPEHAEVLRKQYAGEAKTRVVVSTTWVESKPSTAPSSRKKS